MIAAQKKMRRSNYGRGETVAGWLFALPAILGFVILMLVPMIVSLFLSMTDYSAFKAEINFIGLDNFRTMFAVASCMVWVWLLNQQYGLLTTFIKSLGFGTPGWLWDKNTVIPTIVMTGLWGTGGTMVIFLAGLQGIPQVYYEALSVDGGNAWHKLWHITIPMLTPTIFFNAIMAVINSLQVFTQGFIMTKGGPGNASLFYVYYLYKQAFEKANMGYACALAWFLFVIIMILTAIIMKSQNKWDY